MQLVLPAMPCRQGQRIDYTTVLKFKEIEKLSILCDFSDKPLEQKYQRPLNIKRIKSLAYYIQKNFEGGYIIPSLILGINKEAILYKGAELSGELVVNLDTAKISIHDGQHRWHGLLEALKKAKGVGLDRYKSITQDELLVQFVVSPSLEHSRQIFADINGFAKPSNKSLNLLFDKRHPNNDINYHVWQNIPIFNQFIEIEKGIITNDKLWFYSNLCAANKLFLDDVNLPLKDKMSCLCIYWQSVFDNIELWQELLHFELKTNLNQYKKESIVVSGLALYSLAMVGKSLFSLYYPDNWNIDELNKILVPLKKINWNRSNPDYLTFCLHPKELKILSSKNAKESLANYILQQLGV